MFRICQLIVVLSLVTQSFAAYCSGRPADGERTNELPIVDQPLKFVRQVKNAKLFTAGPSNAPFPLVHVYGTPYEIGFAQGTVQKRAIVEFVTKTWAYLTSMLVEAFPDDFVPPQIKALIIQKGMDGALDWVIKTTSPFTPAAYVEEMHGLADATGLSFDLLYRINMFPELTKGEEMASYSVCSESECLVFFVIDPFHDFFSLLVFFCVSWNFSLLQFERIWRVGPISS